MFLFQYVDGLPVFVHEPYNPKKEIKVSSYFYYSPEVSSYFYYPPEVSS